MDLLSHLQLGLSTAATFDNLLYCFVGVTLGTLIGVLPGLGPVPTIAMLLPLTFGMSPDTAMIMLAGIFYGAQYGGSTSAILVNLPGESSSVITAIEGHQLARQGKAGKALAVAAIGSFVAGTIAAVFIALFAPPLAEMAIRFGAPEYFSLMLCGLVAAVLLANGSLLHGFGMMVLGLLLGLVGTDVNSGIQRFTFGVGELADGVGFVVVAMGLFGLGEIMANLDRQEAGHRPASQVGGLWLSRDDMRRTAGPILRGTLFGSILGILPGGGALLSSFAAYSVEKKISPNRRQFGHGALEGVAAPEAANNAGAQTSFIPMLTLGIPSNPVMALMISAMMIQGIQPGPSVMIDRPELFWGVIASMWIGNVMLLVLNLPMIGLWVKLIAVPYLRLYPAILMLCAVGVFSISSSTFDLYLMAGFGALGYVFAKLELEAAPLLLGLLLGPMMEEYLRRSLLLSGGDIAILFTRPVSATLLAVAAVGTVIVMLPAIKQRRSKVFME
ncbi:tripartite tricarboxylate transporter permease [Aquabacter cavernae]|uniref:tripartite tricarboxylate transporter permease n=1 Tax=Aquabacter cavernae TaxID=2496029 RepID=UPI000F8E22D5|nr:tripartite tricarboxylate transporter permease [Aquabacter cavernae]